MANPPFQWAKNAAPVLCELQGQVLPFAAKSKTCLLMLSSVSILINVRSHGSLE